MSIIKSLNKKIQLNPLYIYQIINLLSKIDSIKAQFKAENNLSVFTIEELSKNNIVTSAAASNRIENIVLTDEQVNKLFISKKKDHFKRNEAEVVGYIEILQTIIEDFNNIPLNQTNVLNIHNQLLRHSDVNMKYRGKYKLKDNQIALANDKGEVLGVLFQPTSASMVNEEMRDLLDWTKQQLELGEVHQLIIISTFIIEFLAIHPFDDGNGRVSRILTILLLLQGGYEFTKYVSHEKMIENSREEYYNTLRDSRKNWRNEDEDICPWIIYFLKTVLKQAGEALNLLDFDNFEEQLSEKQLEVWKSIRSLKSFSRKEVQELTNMPLGTINQILIKLMSLGKIVKTGNGRAVRYIVK